VPFAPADLVAAGTLPRAWVARRDAAPDQPVLHDEAHGWITGSSLAARSAAAAGVLAAAGLVAGDRVLFLHRSSIELVEFHVAALRLGLVVVPVNPAYSEREIAHIVSDAAPAGMVTDDAARGRWAAAAAATGASSFVVIDPATTSSAGSVLVELDRATGDDPALICYTSGTTGAPKGAVLTHGNVLASAAAVTLAWRWSPADRLVLALPLFHMHGLGVALHGTLYAGASAVLVPRFDADAVLDAVAAHGATLFFGVPTMYRRLMDSPRAAELGAVRLCVSGSAPLDASLFEEIEARTGHRPLERYGMSETLMNVSNPHDGERRPGSVGLPLPGVSMRLADDDGRSGEILLQGPNVFAGYWRNDAATAESFTADGWFRTGDVGELDDDGYLRIVARAKELIITGGYNVYPREVEEVLATHPDVLEAAVAGTPSAEWGEVVTAYVVPAVDHPDIDAVLAHAASHLAPYKRPRAVHLLDALPRNALGKIVRHELQPPQA
jgi:malonyl-CoA/methylmalonyl-CoA synthetase